MERCENLSYTRSLSPGKAYFYRLGEKGEMLPIDVDQTRILGQNSDFSKGYKPDYSPKPTTARDFGHGNPQFIEACYVPVGADEIYCGFSLRVQANTLKPNTCSNESARNVLEALSKQYGKSGGFKELAERYAKNLLMGTWLWRNRDFRNVEIEVKCGDGSVIRVDRAQRLSWSGKWPKEAQSALKTLTKYISNGLSDKSDSYYMDVKAIISVGWGDELYPSQEFLDEKVDGKPSKQLAKTLLSEGQQTASFHAQKVGAAIQSIDDWWAPDADVAIRINEYGAHREYGTSRRHPSTKQDFYALLKDADLWLEKMSDTDNIPDEVHYLLAVMAKGGLFSNGQPKKKG